MSGLRPFGLIATSVWQSERFTSLQCLDARLAYLWLHTSSKTCAGVMRLGPAHLLEEVDFVDSLERSSEIFAEMVDAELIHWQRPYVIIHKYLSHNPVKSYRHAIGAFNEALAMPNSDAKTSLIAELQKQSGAMDLANWRDKSGQPHQVLFDIYSYLAEHSEISETASEPFSNPPGKIYKDNLNEKGEGRILPGTGFPNEETSLPDQPSNLQRNEPRPTEATKLSRLAQDLSAQRKIN